MKITHFFLGANSGAGFYSLYDELTDLRCARRVYILKGGAGCGKSTFIKTVAAAAVAAGEDVEYLHCSSDADSLDGVSLPALGCAVVDGTPPHVVEAKYHGAVERYLDMGRYCAGAPDRETVIRLSDEYPKEYPAVYRLLGSAAQLSALLRESALPPSAVRALEKRAEGVASREFPEKKAHRRGRVTKRFLSAITPQGVVARYDCAASLCGRVYDLVSSSGFGDVFLKRLMECALRSGRDVIACPSPLEPERLEHLLVPSADAAFVSSGGLYAYDAKPYRRLRLDNAADKSRSPAEARRQRFMTRTQAALISEAVETLANIKRRHDALEAAYNPFIDFVGLRGDAERVAGELLG